MRNFQIAASILSADFARLGEEAAAVIAAGADLIHFDVMDNHYVPNLTVGPMVCKALRDYGITVPIDVHLMTRPVDSLIQGFIDAGANRISFHPEASDHIDRSLQLIRAGGCQAGLAINPATSLDCLKHLLAKLDFVLLMTVNPGFAGQAFIPEMLPKISQAHQLLANSGYGISLAVDGGIKQDNLTTVAYAGADTFIMGSAIFSTANYQATLNTLRQTLNSMENQYGPT